jgi:hypothetical protein
MRSAAAAAAEAEPSGKGAHRDDARRSSLLERRRTTAAVDRAVNRQCRSAGRSPSNARVRASTNTRQQPQVGNYGTEGQRFESSRARSESPATGHFPASRPPARTREVSKGPKEGCAVQFDEVGWGSGHVFRMSGARVGLVREIPAARRPPGQEEDRRGVDRTRASAGRVPDEARRRGVAARDARCGARADARRRYGDGRDVRRGGAGVAALRRTRPCLQAVDPENRCVGTGRAPSRWLARWYSSWRRASRTLAGPSSSWPPRFGLSARSGRVGASSWTTRMQGLGSRRGIAPSCTDSPPPR